MSGELQLPLVVKGGRRGKIQERASAPVAPVAFTTLSVLLYIDFMMALAVRAGEGLRHSRRVKAAKFPAEDLPSRHLELELNIYVRLQLLSCYGIVRVTARIRLMLKHFKIGRIGDGSQVRIGGSLHE